MEIGSSAGAQTPPRPYVPRLGKATRDAFGEALRELARTNPQIVAVDGDVNNSTRTEWFAREFPERFFNLGIAESNMVGVGAGLAACGKVPVVASFACFLLGNAYEQIRMSVAFAQANVKLVGSHGGISIGEDGPSQMAVEDLALAGALPGCVVLVPADEASTRRLVAAMLEHRGPCYLRLGRPPAPIVYEQPEDCRVGIGRGQQLREGDDVALVACGLMTSAALQAHDLLAARGIRARVLDMPSLKPLDENALIAAARETGRIVVAEEHLAHGGLGSAVAMAVGRRHPVPLAFVNLGDTYAESGRPDELLAKYGLTAADIAAAAERLVRGERW